MWENLAKQAQDMIVMVLFANTMLAMARSALY